MNVVAFLISGSPEVMKGIGYVQTVKLFTNLASLLIEVNVKEGNKMPWRLVVEKDVVGEFSETTNYVLQEVEIMEKVVKKIRRYNLDSKSNSYFQFLESTMEQLKSMLYIPKVHKKMKEGRKPR